MYTLVRRGKLLTGVVTPGNSGYHTCASDYLGRSGGSPERLVPLASADDINEEAGDSKMKYTVLVNGERRTVDVPERMPLLWVLRDAMDLKGTKFGCGVAQCGACTVLLDGQPIRSCITPISSIGTSAVTTIESLPRDGSHPLQRAWLELDVPQCGYCQAGQLMAASALLKATPNPTDQQIDTAMSGNVCRCGTYIRIKQAIKSAASAGRRG